MMCLRVGLCSDPDRFPWSVSNICYTEAVVRRGWSIRGHVDIFIALCCGGVGDLACLPCVQACFCSTWAQDQGRGTLKRYFVYSFRQSWPLFGNPPGEASPCLKRLPFARTLEYNAQKLQPINVKSLVMPSSCHALESPPTSSLRAPDYFATAALRTCVLKKPPLVRSITCW